MEIYTTVDYEPVERYPMSNMREEIEVIANNPLSNIHSCSRCNYMNQQVKMMRCQCHKVYYCDSICQKAHRSLHKLTCRK